MPSPRIAGVLGRLATGTPAATDATLLARFVRDRDELSFAELVRRHGAMVLGVCLRVTGQVQDAEDAFQATFLVLARKANSVRPRSAVGVWLHGVALRTALKAKTRSARRLERQELLMDTPAPETTTPDADSLRLLDEEIRRLSEPLRAAVVLCELEGRSRAEAANQLGIPEGTLSSRLATARQRLAHRLRKRGVVAPAVGLSVAVPARLAGAAAGLARGGVVGVSGAVVSLAEGVVNAMLLQKLTVVAVIGLAAGLACGAWGIAGGPSGGTAAVPVIEQSAAEAPRQVAAVAPAPREVRINPVWAAFERLVQADDDWRKADAAQKELAAFGEAAVHVVQRGAKDHPKARVRLACYELLIREFAKDPFTPRTLTYYGLSDASQRIRYLCAYSLGDAKVYAAHRRLRHVMNDEKNDERTRLAAAQSLAQLGEGDVIRFLYTGLESDSAVSRHLANEGLKTLTGKTLNDFDGYNFFEGASISGGVESVTEFDAIAEAKKRKERYQAIHSFCTWLKKERPDLYKHLTGGP